MTTEATCPRCGALLNDHKMGGLCRHCIGKAIFQGLDPSEAEIETVDVDTRELKTEMSVGSKEDYAAAVGQTIGRYKLREQIGEGGFGVVYVAEQFEPIRRKVALKLIKLGMDTKQVVSRFEAERQALAMMDHPNIAQALDAGATESGRPYFVMELVPGIKITKFCDENRFNTRERLELFIKVCQAIQHAHQKGIIHRDIKPSNVLVTMHDDQPVPKVIDFGIAKATAGRLTDATLYTQMQQFMGTPVYMSPEQAMMSGLDVDTRSDIYSLGVLLYELLAGSPPFAEKDLLSMGLEAMRQTIRDKEPSRPSTKLRELLDADLTTTAERRSSSAPTLVHQLRGDLDWIVMKCLEKDRKRRYETANELAADIRRHLNDEPVLARSPSAVYRFQKTFRRNKGVFATGALVATTLIAGILLTSWQMVEARKARAKEMQQRLIAEAAEKKIAASLYTSLFGQMKAIRTARQVGYREDVFQLVGQALELGAAEKNLLHLRNEAVGCMGDFVGFHPKPIVTESFDQMELSPDGKWLALWNRTGKIEFRELASGRQAGRYKMGPGWNARFGKFNAAGDRLLWILGESEDSQVELFTLSQDREWRKTSTQSIPNAGTPLATSDSLFVVVSNGSQVHLIDPVTGRTNNSFNVPMNQGLEGRRLSFSPDGQKLAMLTRNETYIELWDLQKEQFLGSFPPGVPSGQHIEFNQDGRYLGALTGHGMFVYETQTFSKIDEFYAPPGPHYSFLNGSSLMAVPFPQTKELHIRDYLKKETIAVLGEEDPPLQAIFAPEGDILLTRSAVGVNSYSLNSAPERLALNGHLSGVAAITFSLDGSRLASVSSDHTVRMWNVKSGQQIWKRDLIQSGGDVAFSPDGRLLATGTHVSYWLQLWDAESGSEVLRLKGSGDWTVSLGFVTDADKGLVLARKNFHNVESWQIGDMATVLRGEKESIQRVSLYSPQKIDHLYSVPGSPLIAIAKSSGSLDIVQHPFDSTPVIAPTKITPEQAENYSISPDGRTLIVLTREMQVVLIDVSTGSQIRTFPVPGKSSEYRRIALSSKGRWLAVTSVSRRGLDVYDLATGEPQYTLPDREGAIKQVTWHPDDESRLAVGRQNGDIAIWDLAQIDQQLHNLGLGFTAQAKN